MTNNQTQLAALETRRAALVASLREMLEAEQPDGAAIAAARGQLEAIDDFQLPKLRDAILAERRAATANEAEALSDEIAERGTLDMSLSAKRYQLLRQVEDLSRFSDAESFARLSAVYADLAGIERQRVPNADALKTLSARQVEMQRA